MCAYMCMCVSQTNLSNDSFVHFAPQSVLVCFIEINNCSIPPHLFKEGVIHHLTSASQATYSTACGDVYYRETSVPCGACSVGDC